MDAKGGIVLLLALLALFLLFRPLSKRKRKRTKAEVARAIEAFILGNEQPAVGQCPYEWDEFISVPIANPELENIRIRCAQLPEEFPSTTPQTYCNPQGIQVLRDYAKQLRTSN